MMLGPDDSCKLASYVERRVTDKPNQTMSPLFSAARMGKKTLWMLFAVNVLLLAAPTPSIRAHGGGCRKNSPPGHCCHMDRKAGTSHCH